MAIDKDVLGVTSAATCDELEQKIEAIHAAHRNALKKKQADYDETTKHGTLSP